jgi:class 3 adenylate cyclase/tetratricopeptide (TPR) repeat protein
MSRSANFREDGAGRSNICAMPESSIHAIDRIMSEALPSDQVSNQVEVADSKSADNAPGLEKLLRGRTLSLRDLRREWEERDRRAWSANPQLYELLAEDLRRRGEVFWCYDVATEGLELCGAVVRLRQLQALALADSGALRAAGVLLEKLLDEEGPSAETLGLLARTHKDRAHFAELEDRRRFHFDKARHHYRTAFRLFADYYPGINAASLALLAGDSEEARTLAMEVSALCLQEKEADGNLWNVATRAEAALILGEVGKAARLYRSAIQSAGQDFAIVASMRRQAFLLATHVGIDQREIEDCFLMPAVVVFSGHRIDEPDRPHPRFPENRLAKVKAAIREKLDTMDARMGYASAASGGDILFLEAMLERGGEIHVVLPFSREAFCETSVRVSQDSARWPARYEAVLEKAASITYASTQEHVSGAHLYTYANDLVFGLALQRSRSLNASLRGVALWDGKPGDGQGGTAEAIATWRQLGIPTVRIDPANAEDEPIRSGYHFGAKPEKPEKPESVKPTESAMESAWISQAVERFVDHGSKQDVMAILFADVVGFSKLTDSDLPAYLHHFMGGVGRLVQALPRQPRSRNTWGDAFHFVFDDVRDVAQLALELRDFVRMTDWESLGIRRSLGIRIALHAGTVFSFIDPVTGRPNHIGHHVNRAARIEPIAEEGQIYASESFSALASFRANDLIECQYAGRRVLPKSFGSERVFVVRHAPHPASDWEI